MYDIYNHHIIFQVQIHGSHLRNTYFNIVSWYQVQLRKEFDHLKRGMFGSEDDNFFNNSTNDDVAQFLEMGAWPIKKLDEDLAELAHLFYGMKRVQFRETETRLHVIKLNGLQVEAGTYPALQRNTAWCKAESRLISKPLVIVVQINSYPVHALVDMGSLDNFMLTTIAE